MTLGQALALAQRKAAPGDTRKLYLVCGFQPMHLVTFVKAHFAGRMEGQAAAVETGVYGDLEGNLALAAASAAEAALVVFEWSDIDPRLGARSAGGWARSVEDDILESCRGRFERLLAGLRVLAARKPVALAGVTLPLRLFGHTGGWQASAAELELGHQLAGFLLEASRVSGVSVVHGGALERQSPVAARADTLMELQAGFPYTIAHTSVLARQVVDLLYPPAPKKGLITDLDDTFWAGIVGEVGAGGVHWSLTEHAQIHGLYQQMLRHLSEMGVLLAIASKNEAAVVTETLGRDDLLVEAKSFFPVCANWGAKSQSVGEILRAWNIGADSVVFVDDSAMELEEVGSAHPGITCLQFTRKQPGKVMELLSQLRDLFGKARIHEEDALRQASIRANAEIQAAAGGAAGGEFIRNLQGRTTFDCRKDPANKRILELINKTNQFNLNGLRLSEGEWLKFLEEECAVAVGVSHEEKFGPLGTIGVLAGREVDGSFELTSWVLSCRAFSRKLERHMLDFLFRERGVAEVRLAYRPTERNRPLQNYLESLGLCVDQEGEMLLTREQFENHGEELPHEVRLQN